jgi:hypothetical protein
MAGLGTDVKTAIDTARITANAEWMASSPPGCRNLVTRYSMMNNFINQNIKCNHNEYLYGFQSVNDVYQYTCCTVPIGQKGARGLPGFPGDRGDIGDKGPRGNPGRKGPQGEKGPDGPQGEKGLQGDTRLGQMGQMGQMNPLRPMSLHGTNDIDQTMSLLEIQDRIRKIISSKKSGYPTNSQIPNDIPPLSNKDSPSIIQGQSYQSVQSSK